MTGDSLDVTAVDFRQPVPASRGELMAVFDASLAATRLYLAALDDARATEAWTLRAGETSWSRLRAPG